MVTRGVCWTGALWRHGHGSEQHLEGRTTLFILARKPLRTRSGTQCAGDATCDMQFNGKNSFFALLLTVHLFSVVTCGWTALLGVSDCRATCLCQVSSRCARHMCEILDPTARVRGRFSWEGVFVGFLTCSADLDVRVGGQRI